MGAKKLNITTDLESRRLFDVEGASLISDEEIICILNSSEWLYIAPDQKQRLREMMPGQVNYEVIKNA